MATSACALSALAALLPCGTALRLPAAVGRRQALLSGAALLGGAQPAFAKSKKSMNSNKQEAFPADIAQPPEGRQDGVLRGPAEPV